MKIAALALLMFVQATFAEDCDKILAKVPFDTVRGISFDRWSLPKELPFQLVLRALITKLPANRPILILDTNPGATDWHGHNIIGASADLRFPGRTYSSLTNAERDSLCAEFAERIEAQLEADGKTVFIVDHHFRSSFLNDASTTPLMIDFVQWVQAHPERVRVREALRTGIALRDHSDADILLSNFALSLLMKPGVLKRWAPLLRRIALLNDHAFLDPNLTPREKFETEIGLAMAVAFEKLIPEDMDGGFQKALDQLPRALKWVREGVAEISDDNENALASFLTWAAPQDLESVARMMRAESKSKNQLGQLLHEMFATKTDVTHAGPLLALRFRNMRPSGLDVLQYMKLHPELLPEGIKVLAILGTEFEEGVEKIKVKLRVVDPRFSLDPLFDLIEAKKFGGGGRSSAGSLYGTAGEVRDEEKLAQDLAWLQKQIEAM